MVQLLLSALGKSVSLSIASEATVGQLNEQVSEQLRLPQSLFFLRHKHSLLGGNASLTDYNLTENDVIHLSMRVKGGIDFQHREGSKIGSGGQMSEQQAAIERRERLRKLALETIDITKDPYIMRNHLGAFECKLCLTLHPNEGNYLAHTQGKRHQSNLGRRAAMDAKNAPVKPMVREIVSVRRTIKIGRPGYKVTKARDVETRQRSLVFDIDYPEGEKGLQPRHRFMSSFEQKVEPPDKNFQYLLFACDPYETIAFKIPNHPIDRRQGKFFTNWDAANKKFILQLFFLDEDKEYDDRNEEE